MEDQERAAQTILLADDERTTHEVMVGVLGRQGYRVVTASNGAEMLAWLRSGPLPDLILLGMLLPGLDGWQFLQTRANDAALAAVPVVIVTAITVASDEWAASLGANGLVRKPVVAEALLAAVRRHLPTTD